MLNFNNLLSFKTKVIVIAVIFALLPFFGPFYTDYMSKNSVNSVVINGHVINVEIADEGPEWQKGLMYRESLCEACGMLFQMPEAVHKFWMKNTLIPLDIIYVDNKGIIKKIYKNTVPQSLQSLSSIVPVNGVLEINGGISDKLGIAVGDKVIHPYFENVE